ncbi:hypothetical protein ABGB17_38210 [Sphaerisporangium sp. B11E5]|uniref:hypothetical protein n=1 Tax=Sphaerisporangium sp. B11E5 TaxID=3153563 RepID=UPI00325F6D9F
MRANLDLTCGLPATERLTVALSALIGRDEATGALTRAAHAVRQGGGADLAGTLAGDPAVPLPEQSLRDLSDPAGYLGSAGPLVDRALLGET